MVDGAFDDLLGPDDIPSETAGTGLLEALRLQLEDATPNRVDEQQVELVLAAAAVTETLHELWEEVRDDEELGLGDTFLVVERCAGGIAEQTMAVRTMLAEYGIGCCDLDRPLETVDPGRGHKPDPNATTFGEFLTTAEREPPRWQQLAHLGGGSQRDSIREAASRLAAEAEKLDPGAMLEALGVPTHDEHGDSSELIVLRRLRQVIITFSDRIQDSGGAGRARPGGGGGGTGAGGTGGGGTAKGMVAADTGSKAVTPARSEPKVNANGQATGHRRNGIAGPTRIPPSEAHHLEMP
jgi:hypothetical protein